MMTVRIKKFFAIAILAAGLVGLCLAFSGLSLVREPVLDIRDSGGRLLAELELTDGRFDHVFTHSIHLTPVRECFRVEEDGKGAAVLHLFELRYQSSGVGMPSDAEGGYRLEDGVFILSMDRVFSVIPVMVSIVDGHGVTTGNKFHDFRTWANKEDRIHLSARMRTRIRIKR